MDCHLVPLILCWSHLLRVFLSFLQILLQEVVPHQLNQLVSKGYTILHVMPKSLVELTPGALAGPQIPVRLWGELQLVSHARDSDQFLVIHLELMSIGKISLCS